MNFNTQNLENKKAYRFSRLLAEPTGLLIAALISLSFTVEAATFSTKNHGKYSDPANWKNTYPGNLIKETDTVYINSNITLSGDIVIKGLLVVNEKFSLIGDNNLVVLENGTLINKGITIAKAINNKGRIKNNNILETAIDLINTGNLENNQSMIVGNVLDNTGSITGASGNIIANKRLVNTFPGKISGKVDICSNDFSNVGGGSIDSMNVSFCGNRIFSSMFLTASVTSESIQLNLKNAQLHKYKECRIEKSTDGEQFNTIASLFANEIKNNNGTITYQDKSSISASTLYYRMKLISADGTENFIPPVEVGSNIQGTKYSVSKL
jgi:hypothetical protein